MSLHGKQVVDYSMLAQARGFRIQGFRIPIQAPIVNLNHSLNPKP